MIFAKNRNDRRFKDRLANPDYYLRAIVKLHRRYQSDNSGKTYSPAPEGYNLMQAFMDRHRISCALAYDVSHGHHSFTPAHINYIPTTDKTRKVFVFSLTDQIVNTAVYLMLAPEILPYMSPCVHSYVKGRSRVTAITEFMQHLRDHRQARPDKKTRGLFVLRSDIKSYGESIPVGPESPLWHMTSEWISDRFGVPPEDREWDILTHCIRPSLTDRDGNIYSNLMGIPDGAPIAALLLNLYAKPLDEALATIPGGFYLRFGDDFLFAHPDFETFIQASAAMREALASLQLNCNEKKTLSMFLNGAARPSHGIKGVSYVEYLGCQLNFNGTVGLKNEKIRLFLQDLKDRAEATVQAAAGKTLDRQGALLGTVINQAIKPHNVFSSPQALYLNRLVSDRSQLRSLDKQIARIVLYALTKNPSPKHFRAIPYRKIRRQWAVESLEYGRN